MNDDGYPTDEELEKIAKWHYEDFEGLLEYVKARWAYADAGYWRKRGGKYWVSTAGWSGNESIITALERNFHFWSFCWILSRRGGHYIFQLPKKTKHVCVTTSGDEQVTCDDPKCPRKGKSK
jgi:hypothetical protein